MPNVDQRRPFRAWLVHPPRASNRMQAFGEPPTRQLIWKNIELYASHKPQGLTLFDTAQNADDLWVEFGNFIRQARAYDDAASTLSGTEAALLAYYAQLNLAKAELLTSQYAASVADIGVGHGLSYQRAPTGSIALDKLVIRSGVFEMLYEKRMHEVLPNMTELPVDELLGLVPEIGWELKHCGLGLGRVAHVTQIIGVDENSEFCWPLVLVTSTEYVQQDATWLRFTEQFTEVSVDPDWRDLFAYSRRFNPGTIRLFEGKQVPCGGGESLGGAELIAARQCWDAFCPSIDASTDPDYDCNICPTIAGGVRMTPGLARYALMFYMSSLVRYVPSKLDPRFQADQEWLLRAFVNESMVPLLTNALAGILDKTVLFYWRGASRS